MYRILISLLIVFISSCDVRSDQLIIKNSCATTIYFIVTNKDLDSWNEFPFLPNENLSGNWYPKREGYTEYPELGPLSSGEQYWNNFISKSTDKKIHIYVFDEKTLQNNTWKNVVSKKLYKKEIELSLEELEKIHWTIDICL